MILRDGEPLKPLLEPNILKGKVKSITEKTATHTIFFIDDREEIELEIELSNLVYRRLELFTGKSIQVSLKKSSIWISPEDFNKKYIVK
jgi:molybdopterin-binding protein